MINIATNVFEKISSAHKEEIERHATILFETKSSLKLKDYKEKSIDTKNQAKFYFGELPLEELMTDIAKWDAFVKLLSRILEFSWEDIEDIIELQFWCTSIQTPIPINIFFSLKKSANTLEMLSSLRDTLLISQVFEPSHINAGKMLVVGYDSEGKVWRINYI